MIKKYKSDKPIVCWRYNNVMVSAIRWCTVIKHYKQENLSSWCSVYAYKLIDFHDS